LEQWAPRLKQCSAAEAPIVVDEQRGGDVDAVDQIKAFHHAASVNEFLDLRYDVDESSSIRCFKPKMFSE
jgi:hypothetical protein